MKILRLEPEYFLLKGTVRKGSDMGKTVRVSGISLGSSQRNFSGSFSAAGVNFVVERVGTDGCVRSAVDLIKKLDGQVDGIGLGGVNLAYVLGKHRYPIKEGWELAKSARFTPVVDGSLVKESWEPRLVRELLARGELEVEGHRVLITSVLDRYPLASCLQQCGARVLAGDALLALKLPLLLPLATFAAVAVVTMPLLSRLPLKYLYPVGKKQENRKRGWNGIVSSADVIAGDFHLFNRRMPQDLTGKTVITSTLTGQDRAELFNRGAKQVIALGLTVGERSLGANILDAMITAAAVRQEFGTSDRRQVLEILLAEHLKEMDNRSSHNGAGRH